MADYASLIRPTYADKTSGRMPGAARDEVPFQAACFDLGACDDLRHGVDVGERQRQRQHNRLG
jgi:hypothetical protein